MNVIERECTNGPQELHVSEILKALPQRYPFLLVDRVTEMELGKNIKGYKNVTINEPFFEGHFPGNPIMPGALVLEAIIQLGAILVMQMPEGQGMLPVVIGVNNTRFRQVVLPGDKLELSVELLKFRQTIGKASGKACVKGKCVAEGEVMFALIPSNQNTAN